MDIIPYVQPAIFDTETIDQIYARMIAHVLPNGKTVQQMVDVSPASFFYDSAYPTAIEKAHLVEYFLNEVIKNSFPQYAYDDALDAIGFTDGVDRLVAEKALAVVRVTGTIGLTVPAGFKFATVADYLTPSVEFESLVDAVIPGAGTIDINCRAVVAAAAGNVATNTIILQSTPLIGIATITNPDPAYGGRDAEDDETYRQRILWKERSTLGGGSRDDYRLWAEEIVGVGRCYVIPEWMGAGTGTVKLLILDTSFNPASAGLLLSVKNVISPVTNDGKATVGAIVTIEAPVALTINIEFTVWIDKKLSDLATVTSQFEDAIQSYFYESKDIGHVYHKEISYVLLSLVGVLNHTNLKTYLTETLVTYTPPAGAVGGLVELTKGCLSITAGSKITIDAVDYTVHSYDAVNKIAELVGGPLGFVSTALKVVIATGEDDYQIDVDQYPVKGTVTGNE